MVSLGAAGSSIRKDKAESAPDMMSTKEKANLRAPIKNRKAGI
jgi:hypothetical protein